MCAISSCPLDQLSFSIATDNLICDTLSSRRYIIWVIYTKSITYQLPCIPNANLNAQTSISVYLNKDIFNGRSISRSIPSNRHIRPSILAPASSSSSSPTP